MEVKGRPLEPVATSASCSSNVSLVTAEEEAGFPNRGYCPEMEVKLIARFPASHKLKFPWQKPFASSSQTGARSKVCKDTTAPDVAKAISPRLAESAIRFT